MAAMARRNFPCAGIKWFAVCVIRGSSEGVCEVRPYAAYLSNSQL